MDSYRNLYYTDKALQYMNFISNVENLYKKNKIWLSIALYFLIVYDVALFILDGFAFFEEISFRLICDIMAYTCPLLINSFMNLQFCILILFLKQRFALVNFKTIQLGNLLKEWTKTEHSINQ